MSIHFNGKAFTTWEDVEKELFTPDETAESRKKVQNIVSISTLDFVFLAMCLRRYLAMADCPETEQSQERLQDILCKLDDTIINRLENGE